MLKREMENPWVGGSWKWEAQEAKNRLAASSTSLSVHFDVNSGSALVLEQSFTQEFVFPLITLQS